MISQTDKAKVGAFVLATIAVLGFVLVAFFGVEFSKVKDRYTIAYKQTVGGLGIGSQVQLSGLQVGSVSDIRINPDNVEQVLVEIQVETGTPIKENTRAVLSSQGITGLKYIDLQRGTKEAPRLKPGDFIEPGEGLIDKLTDDAEDVTSKVTTILASVEELTRAENREKIDGILSDTKELTGSSSELAEEVAETLKVARRVLEDNEGSIKTTMKNVARASAELPETLRSARALIAQGEALVATGNTALVEAQLPELVQGLQQTNRTAQGVLAKLDIESIVTGIKALNVLLAQLAQSIGASQEQLRATLFNLRVATDNLKDVSRSLRDKPSRLIFEDEPKPRRLPR
ncbi:MAG: MlaD family protein [Myxococcota bacterium]